MELPCEAGRHSCGEARWLEVAREKGVFCREGPIGHNVNIVVVVSKGCYYFFLWGRNFYLPIFLLTIFFTYFLFSCSLSFQLPNCCGK